MGVFGSAQRQIEGGVVDEVARNQCHRRLPEWSAARLGGECASDGRAKLLQV